MGWMEPVAHGKRSVRRGARRAILDQGLFKVVEINHPLVPILSKDGRRWFDKLTMSGGRRTLKGPCGITVAIIAVALTIGGIHR